MVDALEGQGIIVPRANPDLRGLLRSGQFEGALRQSLLRGDVRITRAIVRAYQQAGETVPDIGVLVTRAGAGETPNDFRNDCANELLYTGRTLPWYSFRVDETNRAKPTHPPNADPQDIPEPFSRGERQMLGADFRARGSFIFPEIQAERGRVTPAEFFERCAELTAEEDADRFSLRARRLRDLAVDPTQSPNAADVRFVRNNERRLREAGFGDVVDAVLGSPAATGPDPPDPGPDPCSQVVSRAQAPEDVPDRCRSSESFRRKFGRQTPSSGTPAEPSDGGDPSPEQTGSGASGQAGSAPAGRSLFGGSGGDSGSPGDDGFGLVPDDVQTLSTTLVIGLGLILAIQLTDIVE